MKEKNYKEVSTFTEMVAKKQGWILNRDKDHLDIIINGLTRNYNRYGYFPCPCRDSDGDKNRDKDIICPCDYSRPDIEEYGHCYCGLYFDAEFYKNNEEASSIPERRKPA
jgi:ferredoxin-thioredoxin reductase catalytic subunit